MIGQQVWRWGWLIVAAMLALSIWQFTNTPATAQQGGGGGMVATRVAVIDPAAVFDKLDETARRQAELNQFVGEREREIKAITDQLQEISDELDAIRGTVASNDPGLLALRNRAVRVSRQLRFEQEFAQRQIEERQVQVQLEMFNKIAGAAGRFAQREGIDLVIADDSKVEIPVNIDLRQFSAAISSRRVMHATSAVDITDAVARLMNNEFAAGRP
ncbi:MAG: OmpH family outer membrane protein [Phycisphaeraceae bacterium]|nr:MAG: OmpH family outer membrane protein [Phycisphaeraceae bacterium]